MSRWEGLDRFLAEEIPFNRLLRLRALVVEEGRVSVLMPFAPELIGDARLPALHGGTLSALADAAAGAAVISRLETDQRCATVDLRIDYLLPARASDVVAHAQVVRMGSSLAVTQVSLVQGDQAIALATAVFAIRRRRSSAEVAE